MISRRPESATLSLWLLTCLLILLAPRPGSSAPAYTTLRFGDVDTAIEPGFSFAGGTFNGEVSWGPLADLATGPVTAQDIGGGVLNVTAGVVFFSLPQPYDSGDWSYYSTGMMLSPSGAQGTLGIVPPAGVLHKTTAVQEFYSEGPINIGMRNVDQDLKVRDALNLGVLLRRIKVENEPFSLAFTGVTTFSDADGFEIAGPQLEHDFLDEFQASGPGQRPCNTGWLLNADVDGTVEIAPTGVAFEAQDSAEETFVTAFPREAALGLVDWSFTYAQNRVSAGSLDAATILVAHRTDACDDGDPTQLLTLGPATFAIGQDWALLGAPDQTSQTEDLVFDAYQVSDIDADGEFYVPGDKTAGVFGIDALLPHAYLLAGRTAIANNPNSYAMFGEDAYVMGDGSYAGWNLHKPDLTGTDFSMVLACENAPFSSSNSSKLYVRYAGISGSLDASNSSVASLPPLELYGQYETVLTRFNMTFLDNHQWQDSAVDGELTLPFPSDVAFEFKSLEIDPCGSPGGAKIETFESVLAYWSRSFKFRSMEFRDVLDNGDPVMSSCGTPLRTLWTDSTNSIPAMPRGLLVETNFDGDGDIAECIVTGEPGNNMQDWDFTVRRVYYSAWDGGMALNGKTAVVGDMRLPFWGATPVVALFDIGTLPRVFDGRSYAQSPPVDIDPDRNGFPAGIGSFDAYENSASHRPIVQSSFANIIPLEYRVKYSNVQQRFATAEGEESLRDLVVLELESSVRGITRNDTEILFRGEFGIPSINLGSLLEDYTDDALQGLLGPLKSNMKTVNTALSGNFGEAIRDGMADLTRPYVTDLVNEIRALAAEADGALTAGEQASINAAINARIALLETFLQGQLAGSSGPIMGKIDDMLASLEQIEETIETLDPAIVEDILVALIELAGGDASGVQQVFGDLEAARAYIIDNLINAQLKPRLEQLRNAIDTLGTLPEIEALVEGSEFAGAMDDVREQLQDFIDQLKTKVASVRNLDPEAVNQMLVNTIYNSFFHTAVNAVVAQIFEPLKAQVQGIVNGFFDALNNQVKAYLELAGNALSDVQTALNDIAGMGAGEISGYAVFGGESLDRLHVDAEFSMEVPDSFSFRGSLDMERFKNDTNGVVCGTAAGAESIKIKIAVYDIPLRFPRADLRADQIALMLRLNQNQADEFYLSDVAGLIETTGNLNFEAVKVLSPSFGAGIGENETYIFFSGGIVFSSRSMRGGIFLGRTCNGVEILKAIDPEVEGVITQDEITGIYAFGEAAIPIYDFSCALRVGATAGAGFWYFAEGPSFGGKLTAGVYGEGLCIVAVRGKMVLIGGKEASGYFFKGTGWVAGGIGWCEPEQWFLVDDVWADKWCATCVLWLEVMYKQGWSVDYSAECHL